ncbi:hypothetical protein GP486_005357 [Trichoglossum hirsutum]|uniref:tripeptidyl-peptidase II n=1 Tax=Trichoglossum hirsutum TaxID=265104 RepID=A0A9P8L9E4_9PEZI|nr:hypothetical protein GP486_005357 [Trichoglossum hirsutum]
MPIVPGSARPPHPDAKVIGKLGPDTTVDFILLLRQRPDGQPLPDLDYWQKTPATSHSFPSPYEYAQLYGASQEDLNTVTTFLEARGVIVVDKHAGKRMINVECTALLVRKVFGVDLNTYEAPMPTSMRKFTNMQAVTNRSQDSATQAHRGFEGHVLIPTELTDIVTAVIGLDNRVLGGRNGDPANPVQTTVPTTAGYYNYPTTGASDQTIGVMSLGNYNPNDIASYFAQFSAPWNTGPKAIVNVSVNYSNDPTKPDMETTQDIETSATTGLGCTVNVYTLNNNEAGWAVFLNRVLFPQTENQPNVITTSWYLTNDDSTMGDPSQSGSPANVLSTLFQQCAAIGINIITSAGDSGAQDGVANTGDYVQYPASEPWATCVGGTMIGNVSTTTPVTFDENAWNNSGGATGSGMSRIFPTPSYQTAAGITGFPQQPSNTIVSGKRFLPDVSAMVTFSGFIMNGKGYSYRGTSCSAPFVAGLVASLRSSFGRNLGFLNTLLYQMGSYPYKDTTVGNNQWNTTAPFFNCGPGYDPVTGWGSIDGSRILNGLARLLYSQSLYFNAGKNSFGLNDVQNNHLKWPATLDLNLEGFAPNDLTGIPAPVVTGPLISNHSIAVTVGAQKNEIQTASDVPQRIFWPIEIDFSAAAAHTLGDTAHPGGIFPDPNNSPQTSIINVQMSIGSTTLNAPCELEFTAGANPYFSNVSNTAVNNNQPNVWWLSEDLRVFTVTPGTNAAPVTQPGKPGPSLNAINKSTWDTTAGYTYIQQLLTYLNTNFSSPSGTDPFATLLPNQSNAFQEDASLVTPFSIDPANPNPGQPRFTNYNFAIARVRLEGASAGVPVKCFFRLFTSNSPNTNYTPSTSYAVDPVSGDPVVAPDRSSIPFFASGNCETNSDFAKQTDYVANGANARVNVNAGSTWMYFGCYINVYPTTNTLNVAGTSKAISAWLNGGHQCLVAEISYPPAPIIPIAGVTAGPINCDKLAQRNLQVTLSDNPGPASTHLVPQTFDTRATVVVPGATKPDELMIDWGNTPPDSIARIYWPAIPATEVVALAKKYYSTHQLRLDSQGDPNTVEVTVPVGYTFVPIPIRATDVSFAGLLTVQLPQGITVGQDFLLSIRRISTKPFERIGIVPKAAQASIVPTSSTTKTVISADTYRFTVGSFALRIPVTTPGNIIPGDRDLQAIIAWRLNQLSTGDRWYPVLVRYLSYITSRIDGLGAGGLPVIPGPWGATPPTTSGTGPGRHRSCSRSRSRSRSRSSSRSRSRSRGPRRRRSPVIYASPKPQRPPPPPVKDEVPCDTVCGKISGLTYDCNGYFCGFKLICQETEAEYSFYCIATMIQNLAHDAIRKDVTVEVQFKCGGDEKDDKGGWREFRRMTTRDKKGDADAEAEADADGGKGRLVMSYAGGVYGNGPRLW